MEKRIQKTHFADWLYRESSRSLIEVFPRNPKNGADNKICEHHFRTTNTPMLETFKYAIASLLFIFRMLPVPYSLAYDKAVSNQQQNYFCVTIRSVLLEWFDTIVK